MKKQTHALILLALCCIMIGGFLSINQPSGTLHTRQVEALGRTMLLGAQGDQAEAALSAAEREIERLSALFAYTGSGDIASLNDDKTVIAERDTIALLNRAKEISAETGGLYSCTVAPLLDAWGFTTGDYRVPDDTELSELRAHVDDQAITIDAGTIRIPDDVRVNVDSIARGYIADKVKKIYTDYALERGFITIGLDKDRYDTGDAGFLEGEGVGTYSADQNDAAWTVYIPNPDDETRVIANYLTYNEAVFTSGGYHDSFEADGQTYHHLIDPRSGKPADSGLAAVSIVSQDSTLAAALSEALCIMGRDDALEFWDSRRSTFDAILVSDTPDAESGGRDVTITAGIRKKDGTAFSLLDDQGYAVTEASDERAFVIL